MCLKPVLTASVTIAAGAEALDEAVPAHHVRFSRNGGKDPLIA